MRALLATLALLGCSIPDKHLINGDARSDTMGSNDGGADAPGPFTCLGNALPTTAPGQLALSVRTLDPFNNMPRANVNVSGFLVSQPTTPLVTVATDSNGLVMASVPTGGQPIDGFLAASLSGFMTSLLYPSRPLDQDASIAIYVVTTTTLQQAGLLAGVQVVTTFGQVSIVVVDCNGTPLANATIGTLDSSDTQTGIIKYGVNGLPSSTATKTDATGLAFSFNVNPGTVIVTAVVNGMTLRSHIVNTQAGEWTQTAIQP